MKTLKIRLTNKNAARIETAAKRTGFTPEEMAVIFLNIGEERTRPEASPKHGLRKLIA